MAERQVGRQRKVSQRSSPTGQSNLSASNETPLTVERIITTAVEMMDAEGIDGLKMRRLADRIGSGAMSLYWHVPNKEHVYDLALDSVLAFKEPVQKDRGQSWRDEIIQLLEDWRRIMIRHPWSAALLPRRSLGPSILRRLDMLGASLSKGGVPDAELNIAIWSLWNYVMGATVTRTNFSRSEKENVADRHARLEVDGPYPTLVRTHFLADDDWDGTFRGGLNILMDGIETRRKSPNGGSATFSDQQAKGS